MTPLCKLATIQGRLGWKLRPLTRLLFVSNLVRNSVLDEDIANLLRGLFQRDSILCLFATTPLPTACCPLLPGNAASKNCSEEKPGAVLEQNGCSTSASASEGKIELR
mmetsp:Transcript_10625/g.25250  ORF Transcript_10625/g.25250 Transcript_10625/m.25250 type:complete len:108 (+) Transcript_10625:4040-4363(+)